jgi:peptidyl-prolyl cis-trans isomerase SurA
MRRRVRASLGLLLVSVFYATLGQAEVINRIVATVDGVPITLRELDIFSSEMGDRAAIMHPEGAGSMSEKDFLDALILNRMIRNEVDSQGLRAKPPDIDSYIQRIMATQGNMTEEQLEEALATQGMSMKQYRKQIAEEIEQALLVNREIGSRVSVSPQDVERYYKSHIEDYATPGQVRIRHIFLPLSPDAPIDEATKVVTLIEDIHTRTIGGEDFGELAGKYSLGPGADQGGDLGFFERGQMASEIEDMAFSLNEGEISQPFRTDTGVHLIKVEELDTEGATPLEQVQEEIKTDLYNKALSKRYQRWFQDDLRFRHHVENFLVSPDGAPYMGIKRIADEAESASYEEAAYTEEAEDETELKPTPVVAASTEEEKGFFSGLFSGDDEEAEKIEEAEEGAEDGEYAEDTKDAENEGGGFLGIF